MGLVVVESETEPSKTHFILTDIPSPLRAEQACICHGLSLILWRFKPSATSEALAEFNKSCLFANTKTGTPDSFSSSSNSVNS